jgi:hypothetical protein
MEKAIRKMLFAGGVIAEGEIIPLVPEDLGRLKGSITFAVQKKGDEVRTPASGQDGVTPPVNSYECFIGTNVEYAIYMEYGTGAHKTNDRSREFIDNILMWAEKRGLNGWGVIQSIRKKGTKARSFMRNGFLQAKPKILTYYGQHFSKWIVENE